MCGWYRDCVCGYGGCMHGSLPPLCLGVHVSLFFPCSPACWCLKSCVVIPLQMKSKLLSEKKEIEMSEQKRRIREGKKFGKKVQHDREVEKQARKRSHMDALKNLKRGVHREKS